MMNLLAQLSDPLRGIGPSHAAQHSTGPQGHGARGGEIGGSRR